MNPMKVLGIAAGGLALAGAVAGEIMLWRRYKQNGNGLSPSTPKPDPVPSSPPRQPTTNTEPRGHVVARDDLDPELRKILDEKFPSAWPPTNEVFDELEQDDVIIFAAESEPTGNYTITQQELIDAKVLSVGKSRVRARVLAPVAHPEHLGSRAGHGFSVGDLVEIPRSKVLVAARPADPKTTGYDSQGPPAATFKPSDETKKTYTVKPGTPYDLVLPYRTSELAWYVDEKLVKMIRIGEKAYLEQIMFSEDSLRGDFTVRALDEDPKEGTVFVARWDFVLDA